MRCVLRGMGILGLCACLSACNELHERLGGYPTRDTAINLETATPNQIADALSQMARISTVGDDWEFLDPADMCTVHVIDKSGKHSRPFNLRNAEFALHRDQQSQRYYATMQHGDTVVTDNERHPLRLFEGTAYHDVFFAEGYLRALADRCERSRQLQAQNQHTSNS